MRRASISMCCGVPGADDLGVEPVGGGLDQGDGAEPGVLVVRQGGAAGVDQDYAGTVLQPFEVGVTADQDVDLFVGQSGVEELGHGAPLGSQLMGHGDAPTVDGEALDVGHTGVIEDVVVAARDKGGGVLLAPVDDGAADDVAAVQDKVDVAQELADLGAEFVEVAHERGQVGVRNETDAHFFIAGLDRYCPGATGGSSQPVWSRRSME